MTAFSAALRLATFRYTVDALTLRYFRRTAGAALRGDYPRVDLSDYPAELHINLAEAARGLGLGRKLMQACLDQMTELGLPGIHLKTTTRNAAAIRLYEKMGFQLLARKRTRLWEPWLPGEEIENLVYGKRLGVERRRASVSSAWSDYRSFVGTLRSTLHATIANPRRFHVSRSDPLGTPRPRRSAGAL